MINVVARVYSPDFVELFVSAAAHRNLVKRDPRNLNEGGPGGIESPDRGMDIEAKDLVSASGDSGESAFNLLEMLC